MRDHATYSNTFSGLVCKFACACALSPDAQDDINQRRARLAASGTRRRDPWVFIATLAGREAGPGIVRINFEGHQNLESELEYLGTPVFPFVQNINLREILE